MDCSRLYSGPDGQTHVEKMDLESHSELGTLQKAVGIQFRSTPPGNFGLREPSSFTTRQYGVTRVLPSAALSR